MKVSISNRTTLVTGVTSGIGREIAQFRTPARSVANTEFQHSGVEVNGIPRQWFEV